MKETIIAPTQYTPEICMSEAGRLSIKGKSYPENTLEFYRPVMHWLKAWVAQPLGERLRVEFEVVYFNSSSSKLFFELFDVLNEVKDRLVIEVLWHHDPDNESAVDAGEDFIADFPELDIRLLAITE